MLELPFELEPLPAAHADAALKRLSKERVNSVPVLLGDADIFSTEWAETVDTFEAPDTVLRLAAEIDVDAWFRQHRRKPEETSEIEGPSAYRRLLFPVDLALAPLRLLQWLVTAERPGFFLWSLGAGTKRGSALDPIAVLRAQLEELRVLGTAPEAELREFEDAIAALEKEDNGPIFPDPVAYVTPRTGTMMAAGIVEAREPWQAIAWMQHGTYSVCVPRPLLVAHCKWLWQKFGARVITASTDHIGFELEQPIASAAKAKDVLDRFVALGATEVNADRRNGSGASLVGAERLWVWWD